MSEESENYIFGKKMEKNHRFCSMKKGGEEQVFL